MSRLPASISAGISVPMSGSIKPGSSSSATRAAHYSHSLYNDETLSDIRIKLADGQHIFGHKAILARQSEYFFRAFTGKFPVASSEEIELDEEDDTKAIYAMVRHIYDLPYDQVASPGTSFTTIIADLMFHINVFETADKYDVPSLRALVVVKFTQLMGQSWSSNTEEFCKAIQRLCGPGAAHLADRSLQAAAASFCSAHILDLIQLEGFVNMLEEGEPFAGRLLTAVLRGKSDSLTKTVKCFNCRSVADDTIKEQLGRKCISCGNPGHTASSAPFGHPQQSIFGNGMQLQHYKNFLPM